MSVVKITSVVIRAGSEHRFSFGVRAWTEMEIWYAKGMYMLKVVSSGKKRLTFKGIYKSFFYLLFNSSDEYVTKKEFCRLNKDTLTTSNKIHSPVPAVPPMRMKVVTTTLWRPPSARFDITTHSSAESGSGPSSTVNSVGIRVRVASLEVVQTRA